MLDRPAAAYLAKYSLMSPERAAQRVRFIDTYRSYVINYNLGRDLVRAYVERLADDPEALACLLGAALFRRVYPPACNRSEGPRSALRRQLPDLR